MVYDASGKEYLDFAAGIAVNALGHSDERWVKTVQDQAATLMHTSNLFHTAQQVRSPFACPHLRLALLHSQIQYPFLRDSARQNTRQQHQRPPGTHPSRACVG